MVEESHTHQPWAEVDSDGQYEPRCEGCDIFTQDRAIASVMKRWPTWHEAAAAAAAVIALLPREEEEHD